MTDYCIAVFDVGKTNKKLLVFDSELRLVESVFRSFPETRDQGILCEDIAGMESWFMGELSRCAGEYPIRGISISTHGAAFAAVDRDINLVFPVLSYTQSVDEAFNRDFYRSFGDRIGLQKTTATPHFDRLLNVAKGIYFASLRFPEDFQRTAHFLNFPQYFGARLTGRIGAEATYVGCHSFLWDFQENRWSSVAERLGIIAKLPPSVGHPWDILGELKPDIAAEIGLPPDTIVTKGIHDSNASLLPYLIKTDGEFILNSTGTWCVLMHPMQAARFNPGDLGKVVFFNLDAFFRPVKTAIFAAGMEYDCYRDLLRSISGSDLASAFDADLYERIIEERGIFILPEVLPGSGQFPDSRARVVQNGREFLLDSIKAEAAAPEVFRDPDALSAALTLSLAIQTKVALARVGIRRETDVFVEGGFRQNEAYVALLTALLPESNIILTSMEEASAYGAAVCGKMAIEKIEPEELKDLMNIDFKPVERVKLPGLKDYEKKFLSFLE